MTTREEALDKMVGCGYVGESQRHLSMNSDVTALGKGVTFVPA